MSNPKDYGIEPPIVKPMPPGASGVHSAGFAIGQEKTEQQMKLIQASGGSKKKTRKTRKKRNKNKKILNRAKYNKSRKNITRNKRRKIGGNGGGIQVNTFHVPYTETGAGNQTVNGVSTSMTKVAVDSHANRQYDHCVGMTPEQCSNVNA